MPAHPAPLPGTDPISCGLFLDLWGTLCERPPAGHAATADEVHFLPGALDGLFRLTRRGFRLYLIGNQDAVAFGDIDDASWTAVEGRLLEGLADAGIELTRSYLCLDHPRGAGKHRRESVFMLPNTGAFFHAAHVDGIRLDQSWVVGDSTLELVAGWRAGLRRAAVRTGLALSDAAYEVELDLEGTHLAEVLSDLDAFAPRVAA